MKNTDVIQMFIDGASKGKTKNLRIEDNKLVNYDTTLAQWEGNEMIVNMTKYSQSTSIIQNQLLHKLQGTYTRFEIVDNIMMGSWDLK